MQLCELLQLPYYSFSFWSNLLHCYILSFSFKICNCNKRCVNKRLQKDQRPFSKIILSDVSVQYKIFCDHLFHSKELKHVSKIPTRIRKNIFVVYASVLLKRFLKSYLLKAPRANFQMNDNRRHRTQTNASRRRRRRAERRSLNSIFEQLGLTVFQKDSLFAIV